MNTRPSAFPVGLLTLGVLGLLALGRLLGDPPRLNSPSVLPNRSVELSLTGQSGTNYAIEASANLTNWFLLSTGIATNGLLTIRHDAASNYPSLFYRGKVAADPLPPLTVGLQADTNLSLTALVSLEGGSGVLYGLGGTRFTLSLPSNSIPDAQLITMTLVTNITGLPFARGTLGTVLIQPADLALWGAASLEITFPTNIDRREIVSFFCKEDGSSFQLTPDRVRADRIVIPILRSGAFGSSLATVQELADAARLESSGGPMLNGTGTGLRSGIGRHGPSTAECFPEKQLAADAARRQIDAARDAKSREIAALLGAERQRQLLGATDDSPAVLAQIVEEMCLFYASQITPLWTQALNNCALGEVLIQNTLGFERQRQLLGADEDARCPGFSDLPFCGMLLSCLQDVRDCCERGRRGPAKIAEVLGLQRQDQLLGLNCISEAAAQEVIDLCSSNAWSGTFSVLEIGSRMTSTNNNGITFTEVEEYRNQFDGAVWESTEFGSPTTGLQVTLRVVGQFTARDFVSRTSSSGPTPCVSGRSQSYFALDQSERIAALTSNYEFSLLTQPDGTYVAFANNVHSPTNPVPPATTTDITYERRTECDGSESLVNRTQKYLEQFLGSPLPFTFGAMTASNVVTGTYSTNYPDVFPPTQIEIKWNFTRHAVAP